MWEVYAPLIHRPSKGITSIFLENPFLFNTLLISLLPAIAPSTVLKVNVSIKENGQGNFLKIFCHDSNIILLLGDQRFAKVMI